MEVEDDDLWIEHNLGRYVDLRQHCTRCCELVFDDRGAMVAPVGQAPLKGMAPGPVYRTPDGHVTMKSRPDGNITRCAAPLSGALKVH